MFVLTVEFFLHATNPTLPTYSLCTRPRPSPDFYDHGSYSVSAYRAVVVHPDWQLAMAENITTLESTSTWELIPLPPHVRLITCKWVYKVKTRSDVMGPLSVTKLGWSLVAFSRSMAVIMMRLLLLWLTTVQTLLVMASFRHCSVSQLHDKNAFLNGELREEVYMQPPPGYSVTDGMVCRLRRSLWP